MSNSKTKAVYLKSTKSKKRNLDSNIIYSSEDLIEFSMRSEIIIWRFDCRKNPWKLSDKSFTDILFKNFKILWWDFWMSSFVNCTFKNCLFEWSDFDMTNFINCDFINCSFFSCNLFKFWFEWNSVFNVNFWIYDDSNFFYWKKIKDLLKKDSVEKTVWTEKQKLEINNTLPSFFWIDKEKYQKTKDYYSQFFQIDEKSIWNLDNIISEIRFYFKTKNLTYLSSWSETLKDVITNEWKRKYYDLFAVENIWLSVIKMILELNFLNLDKKFFIISYDLEKKMNECLDFIENLK